jgi:hypothetical protein
MKYLMILTVLSGVCVLSFISPAKTQAQTCGSYRVYRPSYSYSTYSYPTYSTPAYSAPVVSHTPYVAPYVAPVVKKVVNYKDDYHLLKFVAVVPLVELPTYSAVYTPPYNPLQVNQGNQGNQSKQDSEQLKQIVELLKGYEARFKALEAKQAAVSPKETPKDYPKDTPKDTPRDEPKIPDVRQVNTQKCALCHQRGNEAVGGKFILSEADGSIVRLNNEQLGELDEQLSTNQMPKLNVKSKQAGITQLSDVEYASWRQEISRQRALNKKK